MIRRTLGTTSLKVSRIALGAVTFGREIDEQASFRILDHALACGINLIDTSESYGGGQARLARQKLLGCADVREASGEVHSSELILGRWLASRGGRDRVIVQTKVTPPLKRQRILDSVDASLQRVRTSVIDSFLFHAFDPGTPLEESLDAAAGAIRAGKVRHLGCSNFSAEQLQHALDLSSRQRGFPRLEIIQNNYNLVVRDIEQTLLPLCTREQIGVQTYSPLAAGFLTGKYDPLMKELPAGSRFHVMPGHARLYFHEKNFRVVRRLGRLSRRLGIPPAQLAVAWVLKNAAIDTVLIGARTPLHVDSAIRAMETVFDPAWELELTSCEGAQADD